MRERRKIARLFVGLAAPIIDGYLRVARRIPMYDNHSPEELAEIAAPRFVDLILIYDTPEWPDYPELVFVEVKRYIIEKLNSKRR